MLSESIMKTSQSSRITISVSVIAVVGFLVYNWAVSPQTAYLNAAEKYENLSDDAAKKEKLIRNAVKIKNIDLTRLRGEIEDFRPSFFSRSEAAQFFKQLSSMTGAVNCDLKSLTFVDEKTISSDTGKKEQKNETGNPDVTKAVIKTADIVLAGSYGSIIDFLQSLSGYPRSVHVSRLKIDPSEPGSKKLLCSMNIKVYLTQDKELLLDE